MTRLLLPIVLLLSGLASGPDCCAVAGPGPADQSPHITQQAKTIKPFSVLGPRGALLGQQDGTFEAWVFPWKILSNLRITANMQDYPVPIELNEHAAEIDVHPDETTITYSHANFTVRQIMFAPKTGPADVGPLVFFEVEAVRPLDLTFTFEPIMQRMWPALSDDHPSPEWVADKQGSGFYLLHLNFADHAAAIAMPGARPGILPPYQERAAAWPLQLILHVDPARNKGRLFPLIVSLATNREAATKQAMSDRVTQLASTSQQLFADNRAYYARFLESRTALESPDERLNQAFTWAELAIDQLRVKTTPDLDEQALTAGFVGSGDAARPGFGWFFGRDALWSLYAVDSYGDFTTVKQEIAFLLKRQRGDGKIMHEWSQTANLVDWASLPYEYAAADSTPLLPMVLDDYYKISGDSAYISNLWPNLERAWTFETSHDSDGDGIYENTEGTGWVESWVPAMPHQEIYLAALDQQASTAFAELAEATGHAPLAKAARARAQHIGLQIEREYYLPDTANYAFSRNANGSTDDTPTIFPSVAWWGGTYSLAHASSMMSDWASSDISTDWGTRILSDRVSFYDPISYHQGTVWPLFTGWVSVAEYRNGQDLSGYAHLMQNANLTWSQDLGDVTELLSGQFYQVLGRSTAHQLWSSAMVISPVLRGMFGLEWDGPGQMLSVTPHLPAAWMGATLRRVPFGQSVVDLTLTRGNGMLHVEVSGPGASGAFRLGSHASGARAQGRTLTIPLPAVEAALAEELPEFGAETHQLKVLSENYGKTSLALRLSAPGGSVQTLELRENQPGLHVSAEGSQLGASPAAGGNGMRELHVSFPPAAGYIEQTVTLHW